MNLVNTYEKIFLTSCFKDRIDWYRISQNEELGKLPHGDVFGEKLDLIV